MSGFVAGDESILRQARFNKHLPRCNFVNRITICIREQANHNARIRWKIPTADPRFLEGFTRFHRQLVTTVRGQSSLIKFTLAYSTTAKEKEGTSNARHYPRDNNRDMGGWERGGEIGNKKAPNEPGRMRTGKRQETGGRGSRKGSRSKRGTREEAREEKRDVRTPAPA
jgi:hypothetical protein